ncbi:MAG TPA: hypothetical protein VN982_08450 [Candidatus Dormibacteraeota bacterium]|nr:hypothetical protein [Candidatus Dormibacteraeota bacterium]
MKRINFFLLLLITVFINISCGTVGPGFTPPVVQGQYEIIAASNASPGEITLIEVNFTQISEVVSAAKNSVVVIQATQSNLPLTLNRFGGVCDNEVSGNDSLQGAFTSATTLSFTLTENGLSGTGTLTGTGTVSADGKQLTNGRHTSPAQCSFPPDNGKLTGSSIKPFSGRYAGRITNASGTQDLVIAMMNQTGFNLTLSGTNNGRAFTLTGTVVGASFDVSGSIAGTSVRYFGLYSPVTDEFRVFDPSALTFLGHLQGGS